MNKEKVDFENFNSNNHQTRAFLRQIKELSLFVHQQLAVRPEQTSTGHGLPVIEGIKGLMKGGIVVLKAPVGKLLVTIRAVHIVSPPRSKGRGVGFRFWFRSCKSGLPSRLLYGTPNPDALQNKSSNTFEGPHL